MSDTAVPFLIAPRPSLDFYDEQSVVTGRSVTALEGWLLIRSEPSPVLGLAMRVRDALSAPFGVAPISGRTSSPAKPVEAGGRLDFFHVDHVSDSDLVLTVRDKHLDVMTWLSVRGTTYSVISSVKVHNLFGRIYMLPVAIAHRVIVAGDLKRLRRLTSVD